MSLNSFPKPEHRAALIAHAANLAAQMDEALEITDAGLDRFHCQYRVKISQPGAGAGVEVSVHFQMAEKLLVSQPPDQLNRLLLDGMRRCLSAGADRASAGV